MILETAQWYEVSNRDPRVVSLYSRHYSSQTSRATISDWLRWGIAPNGHDVTMLTGDSLALFGWLKEDKPRRDGQIGVNCYVFRNESPHLSSNLIQSACTIAWRYWPNQRLWTYVNPSKVRTGSPSQGNPMPGKCYIKAGWEYEGDSQKGLMIFAIYP